MQSALIRILGGLLTVWLAALSGMTLILLSHPARAADVLFVPGSYVNRGTPGPMVRSRLDTAIGLYHGGYAPRVMVSGGRGPNEDETEAAVMSRYLMAGGVPQAAILIEESSGNTAQNIAYSAPLLRPTGARQVLFVSDRLHLARCLLLGRGMGWEVSGYPSPLPDSLWLSVRHLVREPAAFLYYFGSGALTALPGPRS